MYERERQTERETQRETQRQTETETESNEKLLFRAVSVGKGSCIHPIWFICSPSTGWDEVGRTGNAFKQGCQSGCTILHSNMTDDESSGRRSGAVCL